MNSYKKDIGDTSFHQKMCQMAEMSYINHEVMPFRYVFVLTNRCNLTCPFCFQKKAKVLNEHIPFDIWMKTIDDLPNHARVTITGGEPLLHEKFISIFKKVTDRFECNVITKGICLNERIIDVLLERENFKVLSISIDDIGNKIRGMTNLQWHHLVKMIDYFNRNKNKCILDIKTTILEETIPDLFMIYKFLRERLKCDTHVFTFLKGSPLQHSDSIYTINEIFRESNPYVYRRLRLLSEQLDMVRRYNLENSLVSYCHPKFFSLTEKEPIVDTSIISGAFFDKSMFLPCLFAYGSLHINYDGNIFPCLSVSVGNLLNNGLRDVVKGERYLKFKEIIREQGIVNACNRCGWLILKENGNVESTKNIISQRYS